MTRLLAAAHRCVVLGLWCGLLAAWPSWGHEVHLELLDASGDGPQQVQQVRLVYGDGEPFSFESFELWVEGQPAALHTGRTDARGLITLPAQRPLRLRAFSADGHGVDMWLPEAPSHPPAMGRGVRVGLGLLVIAGAGVSLWVWRRRGRPVKG